MSEEELKYKIEDLEEKILELKATILILKEELTVWCEHTECNKAAIYLIKWSDRRLACCYEHLEYAKGLASTDHSYDRTDDPYIETCWQSPNALTERPYCT